MLSDDKIQVQFISDLITIPCQPAIKFPRPLPVPATRRNRVINLVTEYLQTPKFEPKKWKKRLIRSNKDFYQFSSILATNLLLIFSKYFFSSILLDNSQQKRQYTQFNNKYSTKSTQTRSSDYRPQHNDEEVAPLMSSCHPPADTPV